MVVAIAKLNWRKEELRLSYMRFQHKVDEVNKSRDHRFCDLGIIDVKPRNYIFNDKIWLNSK